MSIIFGITIAIAATCFIKWLNAKNANKIKFFGRILALLNLIIIAIAPIVLAWPLCIHVTIDILLLTISTITIIGKKLA